MNKLKLIKKKIDYNKLGNFKSIIIGEIHNNSSLNIYRKLLSLYNFDYFISEFAYEDRCLDMYILKDRLDNASNGTYSSPCDYQDNYSIYKLAYDNEIPLIGCNPSSGKYLNMNEEDKKREAYMLRTIKEFFAKGKCLAQLGDHHLRSIPYSKEYLIYSSNSNDDRDKYKNIDKLIVDHSSPIYEAYKDSSNILIMRRKSEYNKEQKFIAKN